MHDGSGVGDLFADVWPRLVSVLVRDFGDLDLAEEAAQEAFLAAAKRWAVEGRPRSPEAWLITTARRKAIDRIRRERGLGKRMAAMADDMARSSGDDPDHEHPELVDEQLALILGCCHPALSEDAQVALTLRAVGGLSTEQIARAFLTSESTMGRRLSRAKNKIRTARIPFSDLDRTTLVGRLRAVCHVIYLIFSEGHDSPTAEPPSVRGDLCDEAVWLAELLGRLVPDEPEVRGLAALVLLIHARRHSRVVDGIEILLADQERELWDREEINRGLAHLGAAHGFGAPGPFQLQAAIASLHATAASFEETNWENIVRLYDALLRRDPTPIVALNRAVAVSYELGSEQGLELLETLADEPTLALYPYFHSARGELLARSGRPHDSAASFSTAIDCATSDTQRAHLRRRRFAVVGLCQPSTTSLNNEQRRKEQI